MTSAAVPMHGLVRPQHSTLREGLAAGFLGATGVAAWLLLVDAVDGRPFYTPSTLGYGLFSLFATAPSSTVTAVLFYTVFHYAAFAAVGVALVAAVHGSRSHPSIFALALLLFMCFELGFSGLVALLAQTRLGDLAWYQVGIANLIATALMGTYLWRKHPRLSRMFGHGMQSDEYADGERDPDDA
jgi:drug/metabolite transporter (DMT)-like permease